ncbi:TetR/AcrR family transcriptional regulator [Nocardia sp. NPDC059180]|uniref:TetR/AcrR family transcriptional regulator n=1 Tax=Nocardia sp. NPDC059180 TaxID=3346761 RepID=UPI0036CD954C
MAEIATAVGISSAALYRHFHNKQELLGHCLMSGTDATVSRLEAAAVQDASGHRVFEELVAIETCPTRRRVPTSPTGSEPTL